MRATVAVFKFRSFHAKKSPRPGCCHGVSPCLCCPRADRACSASGVSKFITVDACVLYQGTRQVSAASGSNNPNNDPFWNFHPYPQRSYTAELKIDL
jgi:hypothetical protein